MSWVPDVRKTLGGSILFFHTLTWWASTVILSTYFCRFLLFVDHVDNARGRRRGERTKAKDDGEASDGNEQEPGKITASRGRQEQAVPPVLVWLWWLEEEETEETRQTVKAAGVLNNLN